MMTETITARHSIFILMLPCLAAVTIFLVPVYGNAQEQDIIGVYFDEQATQTEYTVSAGEECITYWVAVVGMSASSDFAGLQFRIEANGHPAGVHSLIGAQNMGEGGDMILGAQPPLTPADVILVTRGQYAYPDPDTRVEFNIGPISGSEFYSPAYMTVDLVVYPLTPSSGSFDEPVAVINPHITVPGEGATWGRVKSLYR